MSYFLSPALAQLRDQVNAQYGHRDKTSDGWIGDASHQARPSDHNPDWEDEGIVRAWDLDEDLTIGMTAVGEAQPLADALLLDPRTRYVIYEGRIAYGVHVTGVPRGWQPYAGPNAHRHHIHISVRRGAVYDRDDRAWALPGAPLPTAPPEEPDMDANDKAVAKETLEILRDLRDGKAPLIPISTAKAAETITMRAALRDIRLRTGSLMILADDAVPVDVELDTEAVDALADALLERLPTETARAVADTLTARLAK